MTNTNSDHARLLYEENEVLSSAVKVALHTFMEIASDDDNSLEIRIDAASRILGYAAAAIIPDDEDIPNDSNRDTNVGGTDD